MLHEESTLPHRDGSQNIFKSSFASLNGNYTCLEITEGKEFPLKSVSYDAKRNPDETARKKSMFLSSNERLEMVIVYSILKSSDGFSSIG